MGQFRRGCDLLTESIGIKATLATCDDIIDVKSLQIRHSWTPHWNKHRRAHLRSSLPKDLRRMCLNRHPHAGRNVELLLAQFQVGSCRNSDAHLQPVDDGGSSRCSNDGGELSGGGHQDIACLVNFG